MDLSEVFVLFVLTMSLGMGVPVEEGIQLNLLRQERMPSIEYKYVVRTILPVQNRWWRRGTHRLYADEGTPKRKLLSFSSYVLYVRTSIKHVQ
ncbi:hypothetical protein NQ317_003259 [Molorchus minor]|uniref:Uncharacterized protein n=1 Tax=Molorchus minor TaxID=1323400 RepID=A0ABQ9JMS8_9CUCU|nr:hypothetical protein NQ317_003259 [Molorchus minor]